MSRNSSLDEVKNTNQKRLTDEISEIIDLHLENFAYSHSLPKKITRHFPVFAQCIKSIIFYGKISLFQRMINEFIVEKIMWLKYCPSHSFTNELELLFKNFEWLVCTLADDDEFEILNFLLEEKATLNYLLSVNPYVFRDGNFKIDFFSYAVTHNALNVVHVLLTRGIFTVQFSHLTKAIEYYAEEVFEYLLTKFKPSDSEREELASLARCLGNVTILNHLGCLPTYYFDDIIKNYLESKDEIKPAALKKAVTNSVARAYRLTLSIPEVDEFCSDFIKAVKEKYGDQNGLMDQIESLILNSAVEPLQRQKLI